MSSESSKSSKEQTQDTKQEAQDRGQGPSQFSQVAVFFGFVLLAIVGVQFASRPAPKRKGWRPKLNIKFQTHEELALTAPQGQTDVEKLIRKHQKKVSNLKKKPGAWVALGRAWVRKARSSSQPVYYRNAEACAKIALKLDPDFSPANSLLGLVYMQRHQFRKARNLSLKIIGERKDAVMAWGTLSDAYLELGDYKKAEAAAQVMMNLKPNLPSYIRASYFLWLRGDFFAAREAIKQAYDAGKGQKDREPVAWVLTQAAMMHWHEGDYRGADAGFDVVFRYVSAYPPAVVGKARIAMTEERYKYAVDLLEQAFAKRPLAETAWLLGDARMALKDKEGAEKAYEQVDKIGRREDFRTLALFYATKQRKPKLALRYAKRELKQRQDIYTLSAYAWALHRNGRSKEASPLAARSLVLGTRDAALWFRAGTIFLAAGDKTKGLSLLARALSLNPEFDETGAAEAKALLKKHGRAIPTKGSLTKLKAPKKPAFKGEPDQLPSNFQVTRAKGKGYKVGKIILPNKGKAPRAARRPAPPASTSRPAGRPVGPAAPSSRPVAR